MQSNMIASLQHDLHPTKGRLDDGRSTATEINIQSKGDAAIVTDVGQHQMIACRYAEFNNTKSNITSGGLGTMGFGLASSNRSKDGRTRP